MRLLTSCSPVGGSTPVSAGSMPPARSDRRRLRAAAGPPSQAGRRLQRLDERRFAARCWERVRLRKQVGRAQDLDQRRRSDRARGVVDDVGVRHTALFVRGEHVGHRRAACDYADRLHGRAAR
jgi:hypothetical protein